MASAYLRALAWPGGDQDLPACTAILAWRMTTWGAMGVAGLHRCRPRATRSSGTEASSLYRNLSLRNKMAAAVALSPASMLTFRATCRKIGGERKGIKPGPLAMP